MATLLDLSSFQKALESLKKALTRSSTEPEDDELRDACIQRFEYTFELAHKMLLRYLEASSANPSEVDQYTFRDSLRVAAEKGLVAAVEPWFDFRQARNETSHAYNREKAQQVYAVLPQFAKEAEELLKNLQKKISTL